MGKRQHQKDKMYLTYTEWGELYGGKKAGSGIKFRRLPFDHCCLSFQPFENPYCDKDGNIFELEQIVKYIKKFKTNPVTGKPLEASGLIKLHFSKTDDDKFQCPVMLKTFSPNSHMIAVGKTGNVFSNDAIEMLNIKPKYWKDLITGEEFNRNELITLQNPSDLNKFNMETFHHVRKKLKVQNIEIEHDKDNSEANLKLVNKETRAILDELKVEYKAPEKKTETKQVADKFNAAHYSTGMVAAGFTSTTMVPETKHEAAIIAEDEVRYERIKKKGYVRLLTNFGPLNLELYCDVIPKTCENFIKLCEKGYYNNTVFHRSIKHFILQGGDPTGTGTGGESFWGKSFKDEFKTNLCHSGRGILSMANYGPNTNKSQFFITYRSCKQLDSKHTIFGHVVGGMDTLSAIEKIEVDNKDRPIEDVIIQKAQVFVDPFEEADTELAAERVKELEERNKEMEKKVVKAELKVFRPGQIGKYINPSLMRTNNKRENDDSMSKIPGPTSKKKLVDLKFGNFNNW